MNPYRASLIPYNPSRPQGILLDLDGTLYLSGRPIPGVAHAIDWLRRRGHPIVFVTNALQTRTEHAARLCEIGIPAVPEDIVNPPYILIQYIRRHMPAATVYAIGEPPLVEQLAAALHTSENPDEIDVVVASNDYFFDYHKIHIAFQALRRGARFWATNIDATCPVDGDELPDAGAVVGAIEGCIRRKLELITGKPSMLAVDAALERLGRAASECILAGDSLESDIAMGHEAGMTTVLVLTGVTRLEHLPGSPIQPDHVLPSAAALPQLFQS